MEFTPDPGSQSSPSSTMPLPHIWRERVTREGLGETRQVSFSLPAEVVPWIIVPVPMSKQLTGSRREGGWKEGRTNVAYRTLRELHLACGSGRTHDELRARVACARREWTARTSLVTSTNTLQQSLVRRFPINKDRQTDKSLTSCW